MNLTVLLKLKSNCDIMELCLEVWTTSLSICGFEK